MLDRIRDEIDATLRQLEYGEDFDYRDDVPDDIEEIHLLRSWAQRFEIAARHVRRRYETAIAELLGQSATARVGDDFIRYTRPNDRVLTDGGRQWLTELDTADVLAILPKPSEFRITGLESVAERLGLPFDSMEGAIYINRRDTNDPTVTILPVDNEKAPKYAAKMKSGEIRRRK